MKLGRYLTACILLLVVLVSTIVMGGNPLGIFLDSISLIIILLLSLVIQIGTFGWKNFWGAFSLAFRQEKAEASDYARAEAILSSTKKQIYLASLIGFFVGGIGILVNVDFSADATAPNSAIALLTVFYGMIINLIVIEPLRAWLERAAKE